MEFKVKNGDANKQRVGCVVAGIFDKRKLSAAAKQLDKASGGSITALMKRGDMDGKKGQSLLLHNLDNTLCDRVLLIGCGAEKDFDEAGYIKANINALNALKKTGSKSASFYLTQLPIKTRKIDWKSRSLVETIEQQLYQFNTLKSKADSKVLLKNINVQIATSKDLAVAEKAVNEGKAIAQGIRRARDLGNLPGNVCTPSYLASEAKRLKKTHKKLRVSVLEEADMKKLGMGSLLSVSAGSRQPAKLIVMHYPGGKKTDKPIVLVGKGVTFDSGGISIKPGGAMDEMKFDMCGAASVFGTMDAIATLQPNKNVIGIVPTTENMPDGLATKPGDIVTSMAGITIEVLNTDAEGRLILCDALTYAAKFKPKAVIDIATLTGACIVALGHETAAVLGNDKKLINDLTKAGESTRDRCWELPLWDEYQSQLKSNFADIANIGGRGAGTITAACFLSRFTEDYHWAHLDIAGVAWKSGGQKGATGRPVALLTQYILDA